MTATRRRRADAEHNVATILDAALGVLARRPDAPMGEVAAAAGLSRQTVHSHFATRQELIRALLDRGLAEADAAFDAARPDEGPAAEALQRLVDASWQTLGRYRALLGPVVDELGAAEHRRRHDALGERVAALVVRGQREGAFAADRPAGWLVSTYFALVHAAGADVEAGRLDEATAARVLPATVRVALQEG
jgi:AcrR family transcriptional regulator